MPWFKPLRPRKLPFRRYVYRASVALLLREGSTGGPELMFIERARRPGDPWSGDMAFPGGRLQADDVSAQYTAIRETCEETGLDIETQGEYIGRLADLLTRHHSRLRPMVVSPYVFHWRGPAEPDLNHEVASVVWVPLAVFRDPEKQGKRPWRTRWGTLEMPCSFYRGHCIWGLSYAMVQDLLSPASGTILERF